MADCKETGCLIERYTVGGIAAVYVFSTIIILLFWTEYDILKKNKGLSWTFLSTEGA